MPDEYLDRSGDTQAFRAFVHSPEVAEGPPSKLPWIIGAAVAAVVVIIVVAWLALG